MTNIIHKAQENIFLRNPSLREVDKLHPEVEGMKYAAVFYVIGSLGALLSGGNPESTMLLIAGALIGGARWAFIHFQKRKLNNLVFAEVERLTDGFTKEDV